MPNAYILNQLPTSYGGAMSLIAEMLVGAGWSYKASGDGLSGYSATGKIFTGTGTGALGWSNPKAWARMQEPGGLREFVMQHDNAGGLRLKYSASTKFVGGTPSATTAPSATDEATMQGGGTDAAPSYVGSFFSTGVLTGIDRFQGAALAAPPYGFWVAACRTPTAVNCFSALMMDPLTGVPEDSDPMVWYACQSSQAGFKISGRYGNCAFAPGAAGYGCWAYMGASRGLANMYFIEPAALCTLDNDGGTGASTVTAIRGQGLNNASPFTGKEDALPIPYIRYSAPFGFKGWGTMARWTGVKKNTFLDTLNNRQWIAVGNVWLPWDGVTDGMN